MTIAFSFNFNFKAIDLRNCETWPQPIKNTVILGIGLITFILFFLLLTMTQFSALTAAKAEESQLKSTLMITIPKGVLLASQQKQLQQLQVLIKQYRGFLPLTEQLGTVLDNITLAVASNQLSLDLLAPQTPLTDAFYTIVPIKVALSGTYQQIGDFFNQLAQLPYYMYPSELTLAATTTNTSDPNTLVSDNLNLTMLIQMYSALPEVLT